METKPRLYFGHPKYLFGHPIQAALMHCLNESEHFRDRWQIESPYALHHRVWRHMLGEEYLQDVAATCQGGVFLLLENGRWGCHDYRSAVRLSKLNRPLWKITRQGDHRAILSMANEQPPLSVEDTERRLRWEEDDLKQHGAPAEARHYTGQDIRQAVEVFLRKALEPQMVQYSIAALQELLFERPQLPTTPNVIFRSGQREASFFLQSNEGRLLDFNVSVTV